MLIRLSSSVQYDSINQGNRPTSIKSNISNSVDQIMWFEPSDQIKMIEPNLNHDDKINLSK